MWRGTFVLVALLYAASFIHVNAENGRIRQRRSWIVPGTLWCGAGSTAENFTNLGLFRGLDLCCREHDHCAPQIQAFEYKYGIRNYKLHTISHCDCDQRFKQCLHAVNDTMSTMVGMIFFNILEMPCFTLSMKEQCVDWHWWGGCKRNGSSPRAELQMPTLFNYSNTEDKQTPTPLPRRLSHLQASPLHKGKLKPSSLSLSSMNTVKSEKRLLKILEKAETNASIKGGGGITVDRREDSQETQKKRQRFPHEFGKHNFRKRRQWNQERNRRTAKGRNSTASNSKITFIERRLTSVTEETTRN